MERDLLIHQTFGLIFDELNEDEQYLNGTRVDYNIQYTQDQDPFDAYQKACMEMTYRVVAIFGSSSSEIDASVASVCSALSVPYLTSQPYSGNNLMLSRKFAIHLGPSQHDLITAVKETIFQLKWTEVALLSHRETGELGMPKIGRCLMHCKKIIIVDIH